MVTLQEDAMLSRMRFELVPRHVKEEVFWRNYFYRVSLVRQSAQLSSLASQHTERQRDTERGSGDQTPITDEIPEWERELQRELQEFEVVEPGERGAASEAWEREIEELLLEDF
ncbi:Synapse-associated protein 1 [Acipenser ruthenus]|uniref:Synapse-associated protein 1 n=1 Tax=Acipenser ruthenus TaxID=7906 RepID=A0A444V5L0_ACIRT|nr:Synapse-associated protein 1 [Acipenser ruthenus]